MRAAKHPPARQVFSSPLLFLAFGFGFGLAPRAPGTVGTLPAIPLYLLLSQYELTVYIGFLVAFSLIGIWICGRAAQQLGTHDHPGIVWDEFAGYLLTMMWAPAGWLWVVLGYILFRLFDIWKPWPINWTDRKLRGGVGIMLDDLIAACYAAPALYLLSVLIP